MRRIARDAIALSSQGCGRTSLPRRQRRDLDPVFGGRVFIADSHVGVRPVTHEGSLSRLPNVEGIPFFVRSDSWRRNRSHPTRRHTPRVDRLRIIYGHFSLLVENCPAALGNLPFQSIAGQSLRRRPLPHVTPKVFIPPGALTSLNSLRHILKLIPCFRRRGVTILVQ